ncbi:MAG TPA: hypothetical protein PLH79_07615, partial [bacterium]|nr:hypothetical protein [bacterium]
MNLFRETCDSSKKSSHDQFVGKRIRYATGKGFTFLFTQALSVFGQTHDRREIPQTFLPIPGNRTSVLNWAGLQF